MQPRRIAQAWRDGAGNVVATCQGLVAISSMGSEPGRLHRACTTRGLYRPKAL